MEIYNEKARDLLEFDPQLKRTVSNGNLSTLRVREHPTKGIFVQNLKQYNVSDLQQSMQYLTQGNQNRLHSRFKNFFNTQFNIIVAY